MKKLYVGNLPYQMADDELRGLFEDHGQVLSATVVMDRETGRSRGFGFVELESDNVEEVIEKKSFRKFFILAICFMP